MSQDRLPPPEQEACLVRLRPSSQKGGTIVAEGVMDLATHEKLLGDPEGYRPKFCPRCGATTLHVHDYRERILRAEPGRAVAGIVRHDCAGCEAIWQTLPAFMARHLWRTWRVVEQTLIGGVPAPAETAERRWPPVPVRTQRRWSVRWLRVVQLLVQVLASCGEAAWAALASGLGSDTRCARLVRAYAEAKTAKPGQVLAEVAALVYRLQPKVRLM